jgi:hypothetical protein
MSTDDDPADDPAADEPTAGEPPTAPATTTRRPTRRIPTPLLALAGIVLGALIGWGLVALVDRDDSADAGRFVLSRDSGATADPADAATAFLDAWRRYRSATYTATMEFERRAGNNQTLRATSTYTQQPPRRIVRQSDSLLLTAGAASVTCNTIGGTTTCAPGPTTDYDTEVAKELDIWRTAVLAQIPYYRVSTPDTGCFQLDLVVAITDPPYGTVARFCFDAATGALVRRQIVRDGATDTEEATSVSATIPADAFVVPTTTR